MTQHGGDTEEIGHESSAGLNCFGCRDSLLLSLPLIAASIYLSLLLLFLIVSFFILFSNFIVAAIFYYLIS